jgi:hypothetical protein
MDGQHFLTTLGLLFSLPLPVLADIRIDNYSSATNNRFEDADNPDQFFLSSFDLSGVGQDSSGKWATLIGPNTIISANHFKPSGTLTFYPDNDPTSPAVSLGLSSDSQRIGNSDLWLARLDDFAPASLAIYPYATENIAESPSPTRPADFSFHGETAYMTGRSPGGFPNTRDQAYATNVLDDFNIRTVDSLGEVGALEMNYFTNATPFEGFFQGGDSGAPLFLEQDGELILLGINSYITRDAVGNPVASYSSYTGNDSDEIASIVAAYAAIPEPTPLSLLGLSLIATCMRRRRFRSN